MFGLIQIKSQSILLKSEILADHALSSSELVSGASSSKQEIQHENDSGFVGEVVKQFCYQIKGDAALSRIENVHNDPYYFGMEKRMLTVELAVDQHTKICERLDRSMSNLCQAMADLRVQMTQVQADLRHEIALVQADLRKEIAFVQTDLRKEIAFVQTDLRQEIARSNADLHKFFERKFMWMMTAYCGGMFTLLGFLGKYLLDSYAR